MGRLTHAAALGALALVIGAIGLPAKEAAAWWGCDSGFSLQLRNNNTQARCYRAAVTETSSSSCPQASPPGVNTQVGTQRVVDAQGINDRCVIFNTPVSINPVCPVGWTLNRRQGTDNCIRNIPAEERPVSVNVP